jgi:hypothetical protein
MKQSIYDDAVSYYTERYDEVVRLPFVHESKIRLQDHADESGRRCRYCGRGEPDVSFNSVAHAVPEFLGNRDILSMNECDACNTFLANNYEDHLSKWSLFARATSQVRGKKSKPTFKNPDETMRIGSGANGLEIKLTDPDLTHKLMAEGGPYAFTLPADASSQPHIPIRAAMALVKIACSICPSDQLDQCSPAIDWLMGRAKVTMSGLPVLYVFTPGPINDNASEVVLLRRKVDEAIPYMWCVIQFSNYRLQTFVPFCPADAAWLKQSQSITFKCRHFPTRFGPNWPYGEAELGSLDWSGTEPVQRSATATFHVDHAVRVDAINQEGQS